MRRMREWLEYAAAWIVLKVLGILPRPVARACGAWVARAASFLRPPLRRTALINLRLAFPDWTDAQRRRVLRRLVRHLGWMAAEFAHFPRYSRERLERVVIYDGFENFAQARAKGRGVLVLTGHIGAWELSSFAHAAFGYPMHFLVRAIPNPRVDALVNRYRCASGNTPVDKINSARQIFQVLRSGGTVGILADLNTPATDGVFVDFFGIPACTTGAVARIALRTGAPVVPGYIYWDEALRKYRLRFEPEVELVRTGEEAEDVVTNTQRFARIIEECARRWPDQWLWVHKRWKTRPPGAPPIYPD